MSWFRVEMFIRYDDLTDDEHDETMNRVTDALTINNHYDADEVIIDYCNQQHPTIKSHPKDLMKGDNKCK